MELSNDIDLRLIVPAVESIEQTFKNFINLKIERGQMFVMDMPMISSGIGAIVNVSGDFKGKFFLDMVQEAACRLASILLKEDKKEFDEVVVSTVGEILNIIVADISKKIQHYGTIHISTPEIITINDETKLQYLNEVDNNIEHKNTIFLPLGFEKHILNIKFYIR